MTEEKTCSKCLQTFPLTQFYRSGFRNGKQRYHSPCKVCFKATYRSTLHYHRMTRKAALHWYYKNPEKAAANHRRYFLAHREHLNEYGRKLRWETLGQDAPIKRFAFFRDAIAPLARWKPIEALVMWRKLLSLPLTKKQRQLIVLTKQGLTQEEVGQVMGVGQTTIAKMWNGNYVYDTEGRATLYGGIRAKFYKCFPLERPKEVA